MAKITITIEDSDNGKVRIVSDPPAAKLALDIKSSLTRGTAAEGMALHLLLEAIHVNERQERAERENSRIIRPGAGPRLVT